MKKKKKLYKKETKRKCKKEEGKKIAKGIKMENGRKEKGKYKERMLENDKKNNKK